MSVVPIVLAIGVMFFSGTADARGSHSGSRGHHHHGHRAIIVPAVPFFYGAPLAGYYPAPYYPPPSDAYYGSGYDSVQPGQPAAVAPRFFCPDTRQYYPAVPTCRFPWQKVVP